MIGPIVAARRRTIDQQERFLNDPTHVLSTRVTKIRETGRWVVEFEHDNGRAVACLLPEGSVGADALEWATHTWYRHSVLWTLSRDDVMPSGWQVNYRPARNQPRLDRMLVDQITAGAAFLFETVQPETAIADHLGHEVPHGGGRYRVNCLPASAPTRPDRDDRRMVALMNITDTASCGPLPAAQAEDIAALLFDLGYPPEHWHVAGPRIHMWFARASHASLVAALDRYRRECPEHSSVFCGRDHDCNWYMNGRHQIIGPAAPRRTHHARHGDIR